MKRNKAQKTVDRLAADINPRVYSAEEIHTKVFYGLDKKFTGKQLPPEYKNALADLRAGLGLDW